MFLLHCLVMLALQDPWKESFGHRHCWQQWQEEGQRKAEVTKTIWGIPTAIWTSSCSPFPSNWRTRTIPGEGLSFILFFLCVVWEPHDSHIIIWKKMSMGPMAFTIPSNITFLYGGKASMELWYPWLSPLIYQHMGKHHLVCLPG